MSTRWQLSSLLDWSIGAVTVSALALGLATVAAAAASGEWRERLATVAWYGLGLLVQALHYHGKIRKEMKGNAP